MAVLDTEGMGAGLQLSAGGGICVRYPELFGHLCHSASFQGYITCNAGELKLRFLGGRLHFPGNIPQ